MGILDIFKLIVDIGKAGYQAALNRPRVTCDIRGVFKARWSPDCLPDEKGEIEAEGIEIETMAKILLANNGSVDTALQHIYVVCKSGRKELGRLSCYFSKATDKFYKRELIGEIIEPRRVWGPETLKIRGSLWGIYEPPKDLRAELVVEVVAQRPIKKKINLYL